MASSKSKKSTAQASLGLILDQKGSLNTSAGKASDAALEEEIKQLGIKNLPALDEKRIALYIDKFHKTKEVST